MEEVVEEENVFFALDVVKEQRADLAELFVQQSAKALYPVFARHVMHKPTELIHQQP